MNEQRIAVITDSGTDVPADFCREHDVRIVPLRINFSDGTSYRSGVNITPPELLDRMQTEVPKTSLPSPDEIRRAFEQARSDGYEKAVMVTLSSGLSATNQTALMVASQVEDFPIIVGDSLSIGIAAGMIVMETVRLIEEGVPFEELETRIEGLAHAGRVFFAVKDMGYLHRGGRINDTIYRLGKVLNIKPVLMCDPEDGHYILSKKARGWERALDTEVKLVVDQTKGYKKVRLAVCCYETSDLFDRLDAQLREAVAPYAEVVDVIHANLSPDLLVHTGPDLVGLGVLGLE